ncbi:MAG: ABC transporter permease [Acidobacteria bacterium]|nr:ABC transporter permease [Acidobacteriota bacterium]
MSGLIQDLRYGWRMIFRNPGFSLVAILTLALGIGANTALFSAVNALLLRPLPVEDIDHLVFGMALREGFDPFGTSLLEFELYQKEAGSLSGSGVGTPRHFTLLAGDEPERLRGSAVTAGFLTTLGVKPILGRLFTSEEDRPGAASVALVGHELWRRLGADRGIVGQVLDLEGRPTTVVGVLPPGFDKPYSAEVWVPMQVDIASLPLAQKAATANEFVGRLKDGVNLEAAGAELKGLARRLEQEYPQIRRGWSFGIVPLRRQLLADLSGRTQSSLMALSGAVGFLLLLCCANVAGLLLARGAAREGEIAVRMSLGAGRGRLIRQLLTESLLLALPGGISGALLAYWMQPLMVWLNPIQAADLGARLTDFRIDGRVLLFSLAATLMTGLICGLAPALRAARPSGLMALLKRREQRGDSGSGGRLSLGAIVVGEIAIAATLLMGGGLMMQSFRNLQGIDLGFRPGNLLTLELPLSPLKYAETGQQVEFMQQVLQRVRALPGVLAAGMTTNIPMQRGVTLDSVFEVEGRPPADPSNVPITAHRLVTPGYMQTLGVSLLKGRMLDESDRAGSLPVAVVSEEFVRESWPGEDPIGKRVRRVRTGEKGPWMTVVGVVAEVKEDRFWFRIDRPVWYLPYAQQTFPLPVSIPLNLVVRTAGDPSLVAKAVREAVHSTDPSQPVAGAMPMVESLSDVLITERFSAVVMGALAGLGLLLAALGLYGVMAYTVSLRTGEIGLRMALGARPRDVFGLVLGRGIALALGGLAVGLGAAWALTRLLSSTLYQVDATDPAIFLAVALALGAIALLACYLPARRAARVDPMIALRIE